MNCPRCGTAMDALRSFRVDVRVPCIRVAPEATTWHDRILCQGCYREMHPMDTDGRVSYYSQKLDRRTEP